MNIEYPPLKDGWRELTLVVNVRQPIANWIWTSHGNGDVVNGMVITKICEGDQTIVDEEDCDHKYAYGKCRCGKFSD